jgi:hypothetical protein
MAEKQNYQMTCSRSLTTSSLVYCQTTETKNTYSLSQTPGSTFMVDRTSLLRVSRDITVPTNSLDENE